MPLPMLRDQCSPSLSNIFALSVRKTQELNNGRSDGFTVPDREELDDICALINESMRRYVARCDKTSGCETFEQRYSKSFF